MDNLDITVTIDAQALIPHRLTESSLESLAMQVLGREGASGAWALAFLFTTDEMIQQMHMDFMSLDSPTDIMTFAYAGEEDDVFGALQHDVAGGDIVISVDQASTQAVEAGWSVSDELLFLSIHGMLHLLGWNDHDAQARAIMLDRQAELLHEWNAASSKDSAIETSSITGEQPS